jgi:hypothetical protein
MAMQVQPRFPGLSNFQTNYIGRIINTRPPLFRKKAVFLAIFEFCFRKIKSTIDNHKLML